MKYLFLFILFVFSCKSEIDSDLNASLNMAGTNKNKLLKVLSHYEIGNDSLKYLAAQFLIKNMYNHYTYDGKGLEVYNTFFETIKPLRDSIIDSEEIRKNTSDIADSLNIGLANSNIALRPDVELLDAQYLINNIDLAFHAWDNYPWSKSNVSFNDFCKYILPYKVFNELNGNNWRRNIMEKFDWVKDSIRNPNSLREATSIINKHIKGKMFLRNDGVMKSMPLALSYRNLEKGKIGRCEHMVTYNVSILRAMGIPAKVDYVPLWGNRSLGHAWASINDENSNLFAFDAVYFPEDTLPSGKVWDYTSVPETELRSRKIPKIFRREFEKQELTDLKLGRDIPKKFMDNHRKDVTEEYNYTSATVQLRIDEEVKDENIFLCVYNGGDWKIVASGRRSSNNNYTFKHLGCGVVYLPVSFTSNSFDAISPPFLLTERGEIKSLKPNHQEKIEICAKRKYFIDFNLKETVKKMVGGRFEGSNFIDFRTSTTLYEIDSIPLLQTNKYKIKKPERFRFFRFILPIEQCRVSEMKIYEFDNITSNYKLLKGKIISSQPKGKCNINNIVDGDILTYFVANDKKGGWIGFDLGNKERSINKIEFYPPNDGNSIEKGDTYEMFYWEKGWTSLGVKIAHEEKITFKDCPSMGLYLLKNLTKGIEERIFMYENGKQIWR